MRRVGGDVARSGDHGSAGDGAVHVEAKDTRALANALAAIAESPENFAALRERALGRAREFSWQRTAERTREVYAEARRVFRKVSELCSFRRRLQSREPVEEGCARRPCSRICDRDTTSKSPASSCRIIRTTLARVWRNGWRFVRGVPPLFDRYSRIRIATRSGAARPAIRARRDRTFLVRVVCARAAARIAIDWCSICTTSKASWRGRMRAPREGAGVDRDARFADGLPAAGARMASASSTSCWWRRRKTGPRVRNIRIVHVVIPMRSRRSRAGYCRRPIASCSAGISNIIPTSKRSDGFAPKSGREFAIARFGNGV